MTDNTPAPADARVALALIVQAADYERVPEGCADGLSCDVSDWGAHIADAIIAAGWTPPSDRRALEEALTKDQLYSLAPTLADALLQRVPDCMETVDLKEHAKLVIDILWARRSLAAPSAPSTDCDPVSADSVPTRRSGAPAAEEMSPLTAQAQASAGAETPSPGEELREALVRDTWRAEGRVRSLGEVRREVEAWLTAQQPAPEADGGGA